MISLMIVSMALVAPIPKSTYEGDIVLLISGPKKELLLLSPNGKELKQIELSGVIGNLSKTNLAKANNGALVQAVEIVNPATDQYVYRTYSVDLKTSNKPKVVFQSVHPTSATIDRDANFAFISESSMDIKQQNQNDKPATFQHWKIDLKTGKKSKLDLPGNHEIRDIAHDEQVLLTKHWPDQQKQNSRAAKFSLTTNQVTYVSDYAIDPVVISPDGKVIYSFQYVREQGVMKLKHHSHDTVRHTNNVVFETTNVRDLYSYAISPRGLIARIEKIQNAQANQPLYKLQIYTADGKPKSAIFESKPNSYVPDMDWR